MTNEFKAPLSPSTSVTSNWPGGILTGPSDQWLNRLVAPIAARFASDLHLLSPRSRSGGLVELVKDDAPELLVLGGDIFDFRWSKLDNIALSIQAAVAELDGLLRRYPDVHVAYLLGNHDCLSKFVIELQRLEMQRKNLCVLPHHLQLGNTMFLHGDILDAVIGNADTKESVWQRLCSYRQTFEHTNTRPIAVHKLYDAAVAMRVHRLIPKVRHRHDKTIARLDQLIPIILDEEKNSLERVCFGHTHHSLEDSLFGSTVYHNGGACLRHMPHRFIDLEISF